VWPNVLAKVLIGLVLMCGTAVAYFYQPEPHRIHATQPRTSAAIPWSLSASLVVPVPSIQPTIPANLQVAACEVESVAAPTNVVAPCTRDPSACGPAIGSRQAIDNMLSQYSGGTVADRAERRVRPKTLCAKPTRTH
jgi:hypothetical protein